MESIPKIPKLDSLLDAEKISNVQTAVEMTVVFMCELYYNYYFVKEVWTDL